MSKSGAITKWPFTLRSQSVTQRSKANNSRSQASLLAVSSIIMNVITRQPVAERVMRESQDSKLVLADAGLGLNEHSDESPEECKYTRQASCACHNTHDGFRGQ